MMPASDWQLASLPRHLTASGRGLLSALHLPNKADRGQRSRRHVKCAHAPELLPGTLTNNGMVGCLPCMHDAIAAWFVTIVTSTSWCHQEAAAAAKELPHHVGCLHITCCRHSVYMSQGTTNHMTCSHCISQAAALINLISGVQRLAVVQLKSFSVHCAFSFTDKAATSHAC